MLRKVSRRILNSQLDVLRANAALNYHFSGQSTNESPSRLTTPDVVGDK